MTPLKQLNNKKEVELEGKVRQLEARLNNAKDRLRDILKQDDGQAYKEAERFLEIDGKV